MKCLNELFLSGNSRWVHAMEWSGQKKFMDSSEVPFEVDGVEAGVMKSNGPLSFLKVLSLSLSLCLPNDVII